MIRIIPITLKAANAYVERYHRHHPKVQGCKFCIGAVDENGGLIGVAVVGRPVSRHLDDGLTAEVTRLCTNGYRNACSKLYGACARIAREMGYHKIISYILDSECGSSLRASGFVCDNGKAGGPSWSSPSRPRAQKSPGCFKQRFIRELRKG